MAYVGKLFNDYFLEYASYVIRERAIPHLDDGLKPVQRRILQSLFDVDDGNFHKVANIVGHAMQYHPHGDSSIYEALVNLANKELFIDRQGNFGNNLTGDPPSASRYIECRLLPLSKELLFRPETTDFVDSYDGRRREPVTLPAKIPLSLILGAEGIAVGMSTRILPHNLIEVIRAEQACLRGERFELHPDLPSGGIIDVSEYDGGNGRILSRARLDLSDPKRIVIRELPHGVTTESLIASIEAAARSNKIKIGPITDFTTEKVEIEIKLPRGVYSSEVLDGLYAFTDCEVSIPLSMLLIRDDKPALMNVREVIEYHSRRLIALLERELELEKEQILDKIHSRTLEKIFIVERIYKKIEQIKTIKGIFAAVHKGFEAFLPEIDREVTDEDVESLLKIPIRRISRFDIQRMEDEIRGLGDKLDRVEGYLGDLVEYGLNFLESILEKHEGKFIRRSEIVKLERSDIREIAQKNLRMRYDPRTGYLGYEVSGGSLLFSASVYDRVLFIKKDGTYMASSVPGKLFVGKGLLYAGPADRETCESIVFTLIYRKNDYPYIKRCRINSFILNRSYSLVPEDAVIVRLTTKENVAVFIDFAQRSSTSGANQFPIQNYLIKGVKARGVRIRSRRFKSVRFVSQRRAVGSKP